VLHTDGYAAYEAYARATRVTHAQCWAHARQELLEAEAADPERARIALEHIAGLYAVEGRIRERRLVGEARREERLLEAKPRIEAFFAFIEAAFAELGLLPATPFTKSLGYVRDRKEALSVFLEDPDGALDTNHLERALRVVPMGRKTLDVLLDRARRPRRRYYPKLDRHLPATWHRRLQLTGRHPAARRSAPRQPRERDSKVAGADAR
jgi:transposase